MASGRLPHLAGESAVPVALDGRLELRVVRVEEIGDKPSQQQRLLQLEDGGGTQCSAFEYRPLGVPIAAGDALVLDGVLLFAGMLLLEPRTCKRVDQVGVARSREVDSPKGAAGSEWWPDEPDIDTADPPPRFVPVGEERDRRLPNEPLAQSTSSAAPAAAQPARASAPLPAAPPPGLQPRPAPPSKAPQPPPPRAAPAPAVASRGRGAQRGGGRAQNGRGRADGSDRRSGGGDAGRQSSGAKTGGATAPPPPSPIDADLLAELVGTGLSVAEVYAELGLGAPPS